MKLREMIELLRMNQRMEIRDSDGHEICECDTNSAGVIPYLDKTILEWFAATHLHVEFVVYIEE